MAMTPVPLTDQQKTHLSDKRSAHLKPSKQDSNIYLPNQPIWLTDDNLDEWKPGYIESKDTSPDSYWIINDKSNRWLRRNKHDIKPHYTSIAQKRPLSQVPTRCPANLSNDVPAAIALIPPLSSIPEVHEPPFSVSPSADTPSTMEKSSLANSSMEKTEQKMTNNDMTRAEPVESTPVLTRLRSGCVTKPPRNPDFVYDSV